MKVVVASGYFDPLHVGHIEYLERAKLLGDALLVIVNNDEQAKSKKGKPFMNQQDRLKIVGSLKCVDNAIISIDADASVCKTIEEIVKTATTADISIFANGGDRKEEEIPEARTCKELGIKIVDSLGEKIRASSDFFEEKDPNKYRVVDDAGCDVDSGKYVAGKP